VTHEPNIAAYADRVVIMRDGGVVSDERKRSSAGDSAGIAVIPGRSIEPAMPGSAQSGSSLALAAMILAAAVQAIGRNKLRSALTMLGVFIGVAALIAMVAVGSGANDAVRQQIANLGTNLLVVVPGATVGGGARGGLGSASTITVDDAEAIGREDLA